MEDKGWTVIDTGSQIHVVPEDDLEPHSETEDCGCNPTIELSQFGNYPLVVHNSYDWREFLLEGKNEEN